MTEFPLGILARIPRLVISLSFSYLKLKRRVRKSAKMMRKGLIKGGMSRSQAKQLTMRYEESVSIRKFVKGSVLRGKNIPFFN